MKGFWDRNHVIFEEWRIQVSVLLYIYFKCHWVLDAIEDIDRQLIKSLTDSWWMICFYSVEINQRILNLMMIWSNLHWWRMLCLLAVRRMERRGTRIEKGRWHSKLLELSTQREKQFEHKWWQPRRRRVKGWKRSLVEELMDGIC